MSSVAVLNPKGDADAATVMQWSKVRTGTEAKTVTCEEQPGNAPYQWRSNNITSTTQFAKRNPLRAIQKQASNTRSKDRMRTIPYDWVGLLLLTESNS